MKYFYSTIDFGTPIHSESVVLRDLVLRKPLKMEFTEEQMTEEWNQIHYAAFDHEGKLVGILLIKVLSDTLVKMRQVAISPILQGNGIGSELVKFCEHDLRAKGFSAIELNARDVAIPFYERMAYKKVGEEFTEVNIAHYKMEKQL